MSAAKKLIEHLRNNPRDVSFETLNKALLLLGCVVRQPKGGSSHYTYRHPAVPQHILTIPRHRPIKEFYVNKALCLIDEIEEALSDE